MYLFSLLINSIIIGQISLQISENRGYTTRSDSILGRGGRRKYRFPLNLIVTLNKYKENG